MCKHDQRYWERKTKQRRQKSTVPSLLVVASTVQESISTPPLYPSHDMGATPISYQWMQKVGGRRYLSTGLVQKGHRCQDLMRGRKTSDTIKREQRKSWIKKWIECTLSWHLCCRYSVSLLPFICLSFIDDHTFIASFCTWYLNHRYSSHWCIS